MKNTNFLDQVKCIIRDCDSASDEPIEIREEEVSTETLTAEFHPFDIDQVFAN